MRISWYPVIDVLKTTSPVASPGRAERAPSNVVPSASARMARFIIDPPCPPRGRSARPRWSWAQRPARRFPFHGVFRLFEWSRAGSTIHSAVGVEDRDVRRGARRRACPPARPKARAGPAVSASTRRRSASAPCPDEREADGEGGLEPDDRRSARRRTRASFSTAECGAWSVAMASRVPSASPSRQRLHVLGRAERRVHLEVGRVAGRGDVLVGEREVVRRHLGGDREPAPLRLADGAHRAPRGDVAMWRRPPVSSRSARSRSDHDVLGGAGIPFRPRRVAVAPSCMTPLPDEAAGPPRGP